MMVFIYAVALALLGPAQAAEQTSSAATDPAAVRVRLAAYEKRAAELGRPDPVELSAIGRAVIEQARRSPRFLIWSEACGSLVVPDSDRCGPRLWAVLNRTTETLAMRAEAASALMARGDAAAAETLSGILKTAPPSTLAPLAPIIELMPAARAVPLLVRLAASPSATEQSTACRSLGAFDHPDTRDAIARVVAANPPGSEPWLLCMVSRGRLHDPEAQTALWGYGHTLQGDGLLYTAKVMLEVGNESAVQVLTDLTHRGSLASRLAAADLLVEKSPEIAIPIIEAAQADPQADIRAKSLEAERRLKRPPSRAVRSMLADTAELVQIRAGELAVDWATRAQKR